MNVPFPPWVSAPNQPKRAELHHAHATRIAVDLSERRTSWGDLLRSGSLRSPSLHKPPQLVEHPLVKPESRIM